MTSLFESMILGQFRNRNQAFTNPTKWPQINVLYQKIADNVLDLKQWYNYQTEDTAYRHYHLSCEYLDEYTVITSAFNIDSKSDGCQLQWGYYGGWWFGEVRGDCILRNTRVKSEICFNGSLYQSRDTGIDIDTGEFRWGKEEEEGLFRFERLNTEREYDLTNVTRN